jgi:hypothetical protein
MNDDVGKDAPPRTEPQWEVVGIDANSDEVTRAAFDYRQRCLYGKLNDLGVTVVLYDGVDDSRRNVSRAACAASTRYLTGEGHGGPKEFTGQNGELIFKVGNYDACEVREKIVHLLSCETARELGPSMVRKGCKAFFGYDISFTFPLEFADIFIACDSQIDLGFASGLTAAQVYDKAAAYFRQYIAVLRAHGGDPANRAAEALKVNLVHLRCPSTAGDLCGDVSAKIR